MLPSSTQALLLALRLRGTALPNDRAIAKPKTGWHKESGRMEATATGTTTHIGGSTFFFFQKWGGRQTYWMLSRQRRENSVHSTFSTNKEWKRRGGLCQPVLDVNYDHYMSFHKISSSLVG